jgi:DNA (cytosine-5)-methyltransferase 1
MYMDYFDFFSGCGGTSEGMRRAGMTVRVGLDWDPDASATYKANFAKARFIQKDMRPRKKALAQRNLAGKFSRSP